ncbi:MAG: aldehyde dehydrogenase family protein [Proteobacteria bacterium]|nr:aldehyde dehydrogenase family protein [Pseudomonadota bacterium]
MKQTIQNLRNYFHSGITFDLKWRKTQLKAILQMLEEQTENLTKALEQDLAKPPSEAWITEIGIVQHEARYALKNISKWTKPHRVSTPIFLAPAKSAIQPQPRGLALIISPWNYPIQLMLSPLIAAVSAGDVAVLKPSELAPATAAWCEEYIPKYLDPHAFEVIQAGPEKTSELLKEQFDFIFFTGSTKTAKYIARAAAEHLTPTVLELGGKSPCIVTHCKHIQTAAKRIVFAKFVNAGQTCVAPDYVLVQDDLREDLENELKKALVQQFGPENSPQNLTHIIHKGHFRRLDSMFDNGEIIIFGGARNEETLTFAPTLIETDLFHPCMQEEIFGPILPIISLTSNDPIKEALTIVEKHPTPLAAYLFSDSASDVKSMKRCISGGFAHNDALMQLSNVHLPFGGVGTSGHGGSHGYAGFQAFSHMRSEFCSPSAIDIPLRYPPFTEFTMKILKFFLSR